MLYKALELGSCSLRQTLSCKTFGKTKIYLVTKCLKDAVTTKTHPC